MGPVGPNEHACWFVRARLLGRPHFVGPRSLYARRGYFRYVMTRGVGGAHSRMRAYTNVSH
jgi:hypothetical protein